MERRLLSELLDPMNANILFFFHMFWVPEHQKAPVNL